jgi:hypothetical protein
MLYIQLYIIIIWLQRLRSPNGSYLLFFDEACLGYR